MLVQSSRDSNVSKTKKERKKKKKKEEQKKKKKGKNEIFCIFPVSENAHKAVCPTLNANTL